MLPNSDREFEKRKLARIAFLQLSATPAYKVLLDMFADEINADIRHTNSRVPLEHAEQIATDSTATIKKTMKFMAAQLIEYAELIEEMDFSDIEQEEIERRTGYEDE